MYRDRCILNIRGGDTAGFRMFLLNGEAGDELRPMITMAM